MARLSQNDDLGDLVEEISIFQNKATAISTKTSTQIVQDSSLSSEKLKQMRDEIKRLQKDCDTLKESNENHIFINEKLNKALKRAEQRNEQLQNKLKSVTDQSVVLKKEIAEYQ